MTDSVKPFATISHWTSTESVDAMIATANEKFVPMIMARPAFKKIWTQIIPEPIERSTYVLLSTVALGLICAFWQPLTGVVWDFRGSAIGTALWALFFLGWCIVLTSTFMIDLFDLFGLRQVYTNLKDRGLNSVVYQSKPTLC